MHVKRNQGIKGISYTLYFTDKEEKRTTLSELCKLVEMSIPRKQRTLYYEYINKLSRRCKNNRQRGGISTFLLENEMEEYLLLSFTLFSFASNDLQYEIKSSTKLKDNIDNYDKMLSICVDELKRNISK